MISIFTGKERSTLMMTVFLSVLILVSEAQSYRPPAGHDDRTLHTLPLVGER